MTLNDIHLTWRRKGRSLSLESMERLLGYQVANLDGPCEKQQFFYSDLTPVPATTYERTRKELDEYKKRNEMLDDRGLSRRNAFVATFLQGLGDLSGFYFPLNTNLSVLALNKQIRRGALPLSRSSKADLIANFTRAKEDHKAHGCLPSVHVSRCVALLREFSNLKLLHLRFDDDMLSAVPLEFFKSHLGILELCSLKVDSVYINGFESRSDRDELNYQAAQRNLGTLIKYGGMDHRVKIHFH
ncbi:hypothetical protein TMEN_8246 [Trichophyton mentagrophytes]|uniref:Uncharacterized protein n=2 Tax=Trichophyton interdigitale TaxID=101480 RepID=A0A9P5CXX6_9EURO|nr:hypothetical protein H101_00258 [Trichophyton interdigitale H6]KAF3894190.1 hypothetical protein GY631_3254 [Trichophyton interdigitale]KDB20007.1 hypothetical protein H109_08031 [Trichophyton interdigitale MR816]GBF65529.1 hypothetical protein TMEN_8246 [Trichophyton mentagrophytes]KAF3896382.1 hypothetical protein GY632_2837 [Trichophyton interdigitale]